MEYRKLGRTDLEVSVIGFGLIGARGVDALRAMLEEGLRLGINHVDTARSYGRSEEMLGKAFSNRDDFYITSRTESRDYENAEKDLQTSLEMLQTDCIDVYQLHSISSEEELSKVLEKDGAAHLLQQAKKDGRIRFTGLSSHHLDAAAKAVATDLFDTLVIPFSPVEYSAKHLQLIQICKDLDVGVVAMKPLSGGNFVHRIDDIISFIMQHNIAAAITGTAQSEELRQNAEAGSNLRILPLDEFDSLMEEAAQLGQSFCRRCGYCLPCDEEIPIREIMMSDAYIRGNPDFVQMFGGREGLKFFQSAIERCTTCEECVERCPYDLPIPELMPKKLEFFEEVLSKIAASK
jgi:predicted aldo/keto reductase-like oxidoreductase